MNADIPTLPCFVRLPFISNDEGFEEAYAFGIQSLKGRALGFHVMTKRGAHYRGVPIHAVAWSDDADSAPGIYQCQLWDCFTSRPIVHVFDYLKDHEAVCHRRGDSIEGRYLFTVDWMPDDNVHTGFTLIPDQNKCAHVMATTDGNLCALPTNRIEWMDGYFIGRKPSAREAGYKTQAEIYQAEDADFDMSRTTEYIYGDERQATA